ncbi:unnamed protein product [Clavelina lepadiformis]
MSEANIYLEHQPSAIIIPLKPIPTAMFNDQLNSRRKTVYSELPKTVTGRVQTFELRAVPGRGAVRRPRQAATHLPKLQIRPRARAIPRPFWGTMAMQDSVTTMREQAVV